MDFFDLREPVNAWSHFSWFLLSVPGTWLLWRRSRGEPLKQVGLLIYGLSLCFCFASSALFHGARLSESGIDGLDRLDHIAIYVLIAGSYTPIACTLLRGRSRWIVLAAAWGLAAAGAVRIAVYGMLPPLLSTALYLAMGWGALFCYFEIARLLSHRAAFPLFLGGLIYSAGAVINIARWPTLWTGVFQAHELFHLFVMAASLAHYLFMLEVVAPFSWSSVRSRPAPAPDVVRPLPHFPMLPARLGGRRLKPLWLVPDEEGALRPERRVSPPRRWD